MSDRNGRRGIFQTYLCTIFPTRWWVPTFFFFFWSRRKGRVTAEVELWRHSKSRPNSTSERFSEATKSVMRRSELARQLANVKTTLLCKFIKIVWKRFRMCQCGTTSSSWTVVPFKTDQFPSRQPEVELPFRISEKGTHLLMDEVGSAWISHQLREKAFPVTMT